MEGAKELSMLYFNHANEHISLGLKGSISKRNGLISVYFYYPFVEVFKVMQVHVKVFLVQHCIIVSLSQRDQSYQATHTLMRDKHRDDMDEMEVNKGVNFLEIRCAHVCSRVQFLVKL